jgi:hypothetical protein
MRFTVRPTGGAALFDGFITYQNLLDTVLFAATSSSLFDVYQAVKVKAIEVWAAPSQGGAPSTVFVSYVGRSNGAAGDQTVVTDTSMGVEPAHILTRPNAKSQLSQWQPSSTDVAFQLSATTGSVVDVELVFRQAYDESLPAANVGVGATPGAILVRGLDGVAASTTQLPPSIADYAI